MTQSGVDGDVVKWGEMGLFDGFGDSKIGCGTPTTVPLLPTTHPGTKAV